MHKQIFVNIAIGDMQKSQAFFKQLGFTFNPDFTNEQGACMVISDDIYAMLLTRDFFQGFTGKPLVNAKEATEVLICLSCESRAEVDDLVARARAAGGTVPREPQDHGFMYAHGFEDLDGHIWELVHMAPGEVPAA
ncbi:MULTISPECIES: VOC family protein [Achromobacter]|uniref:VOC family protein n=1 Tax=Achromobacter spanius TaxID=217203 RepID=A0ABY8GXZ9_9BURK|nr:MULTISPECIES: VOC family protein [Achromobacter]WAI81149.1 VOC family protein [Achromobacter spanius]WEX96667.1 VOC family protein [Achromobacter sp. SS2-2022]WFP09617.1 VOC family protein [Achromobacter spanius]